MAKIEDEGIIIAIKKIADEDAIITIFSEVHGKISGYIKSYNSKNNLSKCMEGNLVKFSWHSRLDNQLGFLKIELIKNFQSLCIQSYSKILAISANCNILYNILSERMIEHEIYNKMLYFLESVITDNNWHYSFISFELQLLSSLGYGLELDKCVITNQTDNLKYISPKSGKAVSEQEGEKYQHLLIKMPVFFINHTENISKQDIKDAFEVTIFFIRKFLLKSRNKINLDARIKLQEVI
jgi:DNA repair protein RecO (recombination protein O)